MFNLPIGRGPFWFRSYFLCTLGPRGRKPLGPAVYKVSSIRPVPGLRDPNLPRTTLRAFASAK